MWERNHAGIVTKISEVIYLNSQDDDLYKQYLFISSEEKKLISISDKVMLCGIPTFHPVVMDYELWKIYHTNGDTQFEWLSAMLKICGSFLCGSYMNTVELRFVFDWECAGDPRFIRCYLDVNDSQELYLVLTTNQGADSPVLH